MNAEERELLFGYMARAARAEAELSAARAALAKLDDRDGVARVIHENGPCVDIDCTDPHDRGYCDKRADAVIAYVRGEDHG